VQGRRAERFASAIAHVQGALGDHQDTVVGEDWLRHAAAHKPEGAVTAGQLIAAERRARADLRRRWPRVWKRTSAKKLRGWFL
jgi:CHAD domain-containing protein